MKRLIGFLSILFVTSTFAESWPELTFPKDTKIEIVSESMIFNGVPMKTWDLKSELPVEKIATYYRDIWKNVKGSLYDEKTIDDWIYINSKQGGYLLTVKLGSSLGLTLGYIGISHFEERDKNFKAGKGFPLPRGSVVINDIFEKDSGLKQRYLLFSTQLNLNDTYEYYRSKFSSQGWKESTSMIDKEKLDGVIAFRKDADELNISMHKLGVMTQVSASLINKSIINY